MTDHLDGKIVSAMTSIDRARSWSGLRSLTAEIARELGPEDLAALARRSDRPPCVPPEFRPDKGRPARQATWAGLWREVLREVFFQGREEGLPALRAVAFGPEGAAQDFAFPILCRFASLGGGRERFLEDVRRKFPSMTQYSRMSVVDALQRQGIGEADRVIGRAMHRDGGFAAEVDRLKELPGYGEAEAALLALGGEE